MTLLAGPHIPLADPQTPLASPQTPLAGPQTPLAGLQTTFEWTAEGQMDGRTDRWNFYILQDLVPC